MSIFLRSMVMAGMSSIVMCSAVAQVMERSAVEPVCEAAPVFTRARVMSFYQEPGGATYVRLKLLPKSKMPFATQTFKVADRSLLDGIPEGAWVKFTSKRMDGENTVTAIHVVAECQRFQPCN
jgi:Cu/Ag efflux protein CusF